MKFGPHKHHHHSIRLRGYNYSQAGAYFVTICTRNRQCLFGEIVDGVMQLNNVGEIVKSVWVGLPNHFPDIALDAFVVMPNHIHGIINRGEASADENRSTVSNTKRANASPLQSSYPPHGTYPGSLGAIVQNFKSVSTRKINHLKKIPEMPVWQRNYYEHVIRNEKSLNSIRRYISENPQRWTYDEENPANTSAKKKNSNLLSTGS